MRLRLILPLMMSMLAVAISISAQQKTGKTEDINITVSGAKRLMKVHFPPNLKDNAPLVISMHGVNQSAEYQMNNTNWNNLADKNGFIVVFPEGEGLWWDVSGDKDITFIKNVISYMSKNYKINKNRVYATGFSLGAMMTYHLLTKSASSFAAFGPVSGVCFDNRKITASRHVPLIHHHGSADDVFKFGGDPGHMAGGYPSITEYVTKWATWNGCDMDHPKVTKIGGDTKTVWTNKEEGVQTVYNVINGAGHWHSDSQWGGINTTDELWAFFSRYSLDHDLSFAVTKINPSVTSTSVSAATTFTIGFSENVFAKEAIATMEGNGQVIELENVSTTEKSKVMKFQFPAGVEIAGGEYKLCVKELKLVEDYQVGKIEFDFANVAGNQTSVSLPKTKTATKTAYTLSGAKASENTHGIVVTNGKKILRK